MARHIDFTEPYDAKLRKALIEGARKSDGLNCVENGTHGVTQGPRLESAAEISRLARDGCTIVGMTGMPEASLARELDMAYACCAVVVNPGAGLSDGPIVMDDIQAAVKTGMNSARMVIAEALGSAELS